MKQYTDQIKYILKNGVLRDERTGTGTFDCFGYQNRYDLSKGFPILTTKKLHLRSIVLELLWFIKGDTNIKYLNDNKVRIWDEWADENGDLGPVYGKQWRNWGTSNGVGIDQLGKAIDTIKTNPNSRRNMISAWNVGEIDQMKLPPCHALYQFYVTNGKLSCQLYQRSADVFLGVPFNITSYALLTMMVAQVTGLKLGEFIHTFGSHHLYTNHLDQARQQIERKPYPLPIMNINPDIKHIDDFVLEDFSLSYNSNTEKSLEEKYGNTENWNNYLNVKQQQFNYLAHPHIKGDISI